jgi:toxin HigB-1
MIVSFKDEGTRDIFVGQDTAQARRTCPVALWTAARKKLERLDIVPTLASLLEPPGNRLERLRGDRAGQYSVRVNQRYRLCFWWTDVGPAAVELVDYH